MSNADGQVGGEQPKTINPSLLNRSAELGLSNNPALSVRRKLLYDTNSSRRIMQAQEDAIKRPKARSTDILVRARDMGKKLWSLDKLQKILDMVLEPDPYKSAVLGHGRGQSQGGRAGEQSNLLQLLQNERVHGPSDRDPTVVTKEIHYFKGPYIYVYDIEEKLKPIMAREYPKVADKKNGEWPQFRVASQGRCPFVEDYELPENESRAQTRAKEKEKERAARAAVEAAAPSLKAPEAPPPKPVTGKRTLAEMVDGQNRGAPAPRPSEPFDRAKVSNPPSLDFRAPNQNAFMSRAKGGRLLAGEPVASGVQQSNVTSAIRSQMISSTSGVLGAKAGTSKEIHGLQRKVLQKASTPAVSQDLSSRRMAEMSHDSNAFTRSASVSRATHRRLDAVEEDEPARPKEKLRRTASVPVKQKARDPKPGYCENCQDKFDDFDDVSLVFDMLPLDRRLTELCSTHFPANTVSLRITTTTGSSWTLCWHSSSVPPGTSFRTKSDEHRCRRTRGYASRPFLITQSSTLLDSCLEHFDGTFFLYLLGFMPFSFYLWHGL